MVIYEVTAVVEADVAAKFEAYMAGSHIADVVSTGHFTGARILRSGNRYRTQYIADRRADIDEYLEMSASALRADFIEHFPSGVQLSREIWEVLGEFERPIST